MFPMIRGSVMGIIWMIYCVCLSFQQETRFIFNGFDQEDQSIHLDGGARILPKKDVLQLTNETLTQIGRAFFQQPIEFKPSEPVSFSTHFVCALVGVGDVSGHGMAFFVSHSTDFIGAQPTRFFGLFNSSESDSTRVLAVELDIAQAPDVLDISENHVGIDVNSARSVKSANASYFSDKEGRNIDMQLLSGDPIQVWVDYEGTTLNVSIAPLKKQKPSRPLLSSTSINLTEIVQGRRMFVGFSGATGSIMVNQYVLGWSFSKSLASLQKIDISKLPKVPHPSNKDKSSSRVLYALLGLVAFLVLVLLFGAYMYRRNLYAEVREEWEQEYGPLRYSYKSLYKATKGFSRNEFLGRGEFSSQEVERVLKVGLLCANLAPEARPSMEHVVQYLNGNLALPEFWPYSPGIGVLTPTAFSQAQLMLPSLSLSTSSSNSSMFITHSLLYGSGR
ncbi:unnamed protein product [Eruca vesicaria subsp. sativa]|uniref:Legume lectin domain-containing protein n=1 Tax=Eruca vesicaria subsp. sativa TaxID=29727 RepID=A0ABC8JKD3_ERUVS|nr:unnamed protein product [Eruca vesicaria subsp. sativa]